MTERTIKNLVADNTKVYVYLANETIGNKFMQQAEQEGFKFPDGEEPTNRHYSDVIAVNNDNTINYVGAIGHIAFKSNQVTKVDFEKYLKLN